MFNKYIFSALVVFIAAIFLFLTNLIIHAYFGRCKEKPPDAAA
jgi:hypothetical protein